MDVIIVLVVSFIGAFFGNMDFFALYTVISTSIALYRNWQNYTKDKTALQ